MWVDKLLELDGMRMEAIVKSKSLLDHSKMQKLTEEDIEDIKRQMDHLIRYVMQKVIIAGKRMK